MKNGKRNFALLTDLYQLTMMDAYEASGIWDKYAVFDLFFRSRPETAYSLVAGLEQVVEYIQNLRFENSDIQYLESLGMFSQSFLKRLKEFKFTGDMYAVPEGTVIFPFEPILTVVAPLGQAQLIETAILNIVNHQTLIASKAARVKYAAGESKVIEFGLRRAHGPDAGIYGARASIIGGCEATSNVYAAKEFGIIPKGTHAHSFVMSFDTEYDAFMHYAKRFPDDCMLLVDTYDTLSSGVPNAIKVFDYLKSQGKKPAGIRIDSGDFAYLSNEARRMLDDAGYHDATIFVSGDVDEYVLESLKTQDAKVDIYGVGTKLITAFDNPSLGGVYKLSGVYKQGKDSELIPKMKISNSVAKVTNPGFKKVCRLYDENKMAEADLVMLAHEEIDCTVPLTIYDFEVTWRKKTLTNFSLKYLSKTIFEDGKLVYDLPTLPKIREYAVSSLAEFHDTHKRLKNPHLYKVDLSDGLYDLRKKMLLEYTQESDS